MENEYYYGMAQLGWMGLGLVGLYLSLSGSDCWCQGRHRWGRVASKRVLHISSNTSFR